ncbi:erythromycin esterase family protein [Sphingomonas sp. ac-8]|uniref:erythromycin esterase family protein n=1 Tax=Sphingomonas sp. ac-8 TaxID=3242977 RepID=UPI003A7F95E0
MTRSWFGGVAAIAMIAAAPLGASLPARSVDDAAGIVPLDADAFPIGEQQILALGEASHGNEDILRARNRLILQLVDEGRIGWVALETGFAESRLLDAFVRGGAGEAADVAKHGFTSGFGAFEANVALLRDLRAANALRAERDKVGVIGIDLSLGGPLDSAPTMAPVRCALEGVGDAKRRATLTARFLEAVKPGLGAPTVTTRQKAAFRDLADRLNAALSPTASVEARTCGRIVLQSAAVFDGIPTAVTPGSIPNDAWISVSRRDEAMASNALNALRRSAGKSVVLFAHTSHVLKVARRGGQWRTQEHPPTSMGEVLRQRLASRYYVIANVEPAPADGSQVPDLIPAFRTDCAKPCVVLADARPTLRRSTVRIGINGSDEQLIDTAAADAFLILPQQEPERR